MPTAGTVDLGPVLELLRAGLDALIDYVAYHVATCLIPAFLLAGAIVTFLSRDAIVRYLGQESRRAVSFPLAAVSSLGLAVCSCTVIPIAAGLYRRGSSIGPAFIFLWVAPAANLLALTYTGAILGADMAAARLAVALATSLIVGLAMTAIFRREEASRVRGAELGRGAAVSVVTGGRREVLLMVLLVATLLVPNYLGAALPSYLGAGPGGGGLPIYGYKLLASAALLVATMGYALKFIEGGRVRAWLHETLWFVRMIFPLLLVGVFVIGVVGKLLPEAWVRGWLGGSGLLPTFIACVIGALSYFATLTEAPFVSTLMGLGMGRGPALALLLTGPGMSLPNMLAISRLFTARKAAAYVLITVAIATLASFAVGNALWPSG
ncbi:MAG: permease [Candidatus Nezhaarchaeales archaeon]